MNAWAPARTLMQVGRERHAPRQLVRVPAAPAADSGLRAAGRVTQVWQDS